MSEELQSLLNKINADGVQKAKIEYDKIVAEAEQKAVTIIEEANNKARAIVENAGLEAEALEVKAKAAVVQSCRDILLQLRKNLQLRLDKCVDNAVAAAFNPELMAKLITDIVNKFADDPAGDISVRMAVKDVDAFDNALKGSLADSFRVQPKLFPDNHIRGGFEVSFSNDKCYYDFSDKAICELVSEYIGEKLAEIFKAE